MTSDHDHDSSSSLDAAEADMQRLLCEAYEAPAIPQSLLRRIDDDLTLQWGVSPGIAPASWVSRSRSVWLTRRWARGTSAAAVIAAGIVLTLMLTLGGSSYAWADMIAAMAKQGVVQIAGPDGMRWLSLTEGVLGHHTDESTQLLDLRQRVLLVRRDDEARIVRRTVTTDLPAQDVDWLVVAFLRGDSLEEISSQPFPGLRVVKESWQRRETSGDGDLSATVQFLTDASESFTLELTVDPESRLPLTCESDARGGAPVAVALSYPKTEPRELRERYFPARLATVDADSVGPETLAANEAHTGRVAPQPGQAATAQEDEQTNTAIEQGSTPPDQAAQSLTGSVSQWAAVGVSELSSSDFQRQLDGVLEQLWIENEISPAEPADDEELLRRVYLDLVGRTPTVSEVRAYLADTSLGRYERLVERLLNSPDHASHVATVWRTFLIPEGVDLSAFGGVEVFDRWLADRIARNEPYDALVRSLLLAEGRLSRSGPLLFYSAAKLDADQLAARSARVFLGIRLECAQCHDHPFESWRQQDFWGLAAFFAQISRPRGELESVSSVMRVSDVDHGEVMLPDTDTVIAPRLLDGTPPADGPQNQSRREQLATWLTSSENPYFARATANRAWAHMFGKGIVDPVDDFGEQNPPTSPELLDLLAGHFLYTKFDLRELFRTIALSRAYRLSSRAVESDERRPQFFAQMNVKMLTAEQMYDCITVATLLDLTSGDQQPYLIERFGNNGRAAFLEQFRTPAGQSTEYQAGIPQALTLMNGSLIQSATGLTTSGLLTSLEAPFFSNEERIEILYLATLSRRPRPAEQQLLAGYLPEDAGGQEFHECLADLLWALLNSAEFTMNH